MDDAGRGDDLVGRIAVKIQRRDLATDRDVHRPDHKRRQRFDQGGSLEVDLNTAELGELCDFPQNNRGDAAARSLNRRPFGGPELSVECEQDDVRVEIQHPT